MPYHYVDARNEKEASTLLIVAEGDYREELEEIIVTSYSNDFHIRYEHMLSIPLQGIWSTFSAYPCLKTSKRTAEVLVECALQEGREIMEFQRMRDDDLFVQLKEEGELLYDYVADARALLPELLKNIEAFGDDEEFIIESQTLNRLLVGMIHEGGSRYLASI